jgi:hypothetical protein
VTFQSERSSHAPPGDLVAGRYRIERSLGAGGMATVYQVLDLATEQRLALKRLRVPSDPRKQRRTIELFEREFHTLSHLAHPRVVEAYDYGVDDLGPYYTMELLDGGELQQLAPLPWRKACEVARDICSALSLVHSRRLVYRDLNPRNVRCTGDGRGKLIDFGAMSNMGPIKQLVGTPAYCAPEALDLEPLDARTDLYSLGATLYFMLTGRHAYPAKNFEQLRNFWESRPPRPAEIVPELPAALDALVMDLIHLDPSVRPANAAEVMEQLAVIEGRTFDELPQVTQAYLSAPNLVGRDALLTRVRSRITRALGGRGGSILIEGASGVGRSRLMNACLLEAKLLGALALRVDATDAEGDYGGLQALCAQLLDAVPELARQAAAARLAVLAHALPALSSEQSQPLVQTETDPHRLRAQVMPALSEWFLAIAKQRPLFVAVDDLHALDEPSAAALALLAHAIDKQSVIIVATNETGASSTAPAALKLFADSATLLRLTNLSQGHTEELLRSVFGDVPQVQLVAHKLQAITEGNPRDVMQLAQYLVDRQLASYRAGAWSLPASIDDADLPSNMAQALRARVDALSPPARELGQYMTLAEGRGITFNEFVALRDGKASASVMAGLEELQRAQVVSRLADGYAIAQRGFIAALQSDLAVATQQRLHLGLAELFRQRGDEEFRRSQQLVRAGLEQEGVDVLVQFAADSQRASAGNPHMYLALVQSLPEDWLSSYSHAIALCENTGRPKRDAYTIRLRFVSLINVMALPSAISHPWLHVLLHQLEELTGLAQLPRIDATLPAPQRLRAAMAAAQQRFVDSPEIDRVIDPMTALPELVRTVIVAMGTIATSLDHGLWCAVPALAPFVSLSAAVNAVELLRLGVGARVSGRIEQAMQIYRQLVELTARADQAGLAAAHHRYLRYGVICGLGFLEAPFGLASSVACAAELEDEPLHQVNTHQIRMLYHLWLGQVREADQDKEQLELVRIQSTARQLSDGPYLLGRLTANAAADDLTRIKHTLDEINVLAQRHAAWQPVAAYARGEYQRIRGDHEQALLEIENALSAMQPGRHQIWAHVASAHVRILLELARPEAAKSAGEAYLAAAQHEQLGSGCDYIEMALALALAALGDTAAAATHAEAAVQHFEGFGCRGIHLVLAYDTRARVALAAREMGVYARYAGLCADQCAAANSRVLNAKYERLKRVALAAEVRTQQPSLDAASSTTALTGSQLTSMLVGFNLPYDRAQRALELLMRQSGAVEGFLYLLGPQGHHVAAQVAAHAPSPQLEAFVDDYLDAQLDEAEMNTCSQETVLETSMSPGAVWVDDQGRAHHAILLSHQNRDGGVITGMAVAVLRKGQPFVQAASLAAHVSRLLEEAGDVKPVALE